jgi:hypothetical protein
MKMLAIAIKIAHLFIPLFACNVCLWEVLSYSAFYYKFPDTFTFFSVGDVIFLKQIIIVSLLIWYEVTR